MIKICCLFLISFLFLPKAQSKDQNFKELSHTLSAFSKLVNDTSKLEDRSEKDLILTPAADKKFQELNSDLEKCKEEKIVEPREIIIRKDGLETSFKVFSIRIYGPECPFNILAKFDLIEHLESSFKGQININFTLLDPKLELKYKIKQIDMTGDFNGEITKTGSVAKILINMNLASNGQTTDIGPFKQLVKIDMNSEIDMSVFDIKLEMKQYGFVEYKDSKKSGHSKITMIGFGQTSETYEIDGKPSTVSEFTEFMESFIAVGSIEEVDPNNPEGKRPMMCDAVIYKSLTMTADNLKNILSNKLPRPKDGLIYQKSSCKNLSETTGQTKHSFEFAEKWISFKSSSLGNFESDGIYTLYKDTSPQIRTEENYTIGFICEPIPKCQ